MRLIFSIFRLPFWVFLAAAGGLFYLGELAHRDTLAKNQEMARALAGSPPETVSLAEFSRERHIGLADEVSVQAVINPAYNYELTKTRKASKKTRFLFVLFDASDPEGATMARGALVLTEAAKDSFINEFYLRNTEIALGQTGAVSLVTLNGRAERSPELSSLVRDAFEEQGLTQSPDFIYIEPFLNGRAAALTPTMSADELRDFIRWGALAAGLVGVLKFLRRRRRKDCFEDEPDYVATPAAPVAPPVQPVGHYEPSYESTDEAADHEPETEGAARRKKWFSLKLLAVLVLIGVAVYLGQFTYAAAIAGGAVLIYVLRRIVRAVSAGLSKLGLKRPADEAVMDRVQAEAQTYSVSIEPLQAEPDASDEPEVETKRGRFRLPLPRFGRKAKAVADAHEMSNDDAVLMAKVQTDSQTEGDASNDDAIIAGFLAERQQEAAPDQTHEDDAEIMARIQAEARTGAFSDDQIETTDSTTEDHPNDPAPDEDAAIMARLQAGEPTESARGRDPEMADMTEELPETSYAEPLQDDTPHVASRPEPDADPDARTDAAPEDADWIMAMLQADAEPDPEPENTEPAVMAPALDIADSPVSDVAEPSQPEVEEAEYSDADDAETLGMDDQIAASDIQDEMAETSQQAAGPEDIAADDDMSEADAQLATSAPAQNAIEEACAGVEEISEEVEVEPLPTRRGFRLPLPWLRRKSRCDAETPEANTQIAATVQADDEVDEISTEVDPEVPRARRRFKLPLPSLRRTARDDAEPPEADAQITANVVEHDEIEVVVDGEDIAAEVKKSRTRRGFGLPLPSLHRRLRDDVGVNEADAQMVATVLDDGKIEATLPDTRETSAEAEPETPRTRRGFKLSLPSLRRRSRDDVGLHEDDAQIAASVEAEGKAGGASSDAEIQPVPRGFKFPMPALRKKTVDAAAPADTSESDEKPARRGLKLALPAMLRKAGKKAETEASPAKVAGKKEAYKADALFAVDEPVEKQDLGTKMQLLLARLTSTEREPKVFEGRPDPFDRLADEVRRRGDR